MSTPDVYFLATLLRMYTDVNVLIIYYLHEVFIDYVDLVIHHYSGHFLGTRAQLPIYYTNFSITSKSKMVISSIHKCIKLIVGKPNVIFTL